GGEIIYWSFIDRNDGKSRKIVSILETLGHPVVVEALLRPSDSCFLDEKLARSCLSYFVYSVNPNFHRLDIESYWTVGLLPNQIIRVWSREDFFSTHGSQ